MVAMLTALAGCAATESPARVGVLAPDVPTLTLDGDPVSLSSFRGQPVLLNLWATWCAPCRRETPYLQELHRTLSDRGLRVVGLTVDSRGADAAIRSFLREFAVSYTVLHDPDMVVMDRYAVIGLPATFLVDREGVIQYAVSGPAEEGNRGFEGALERLLE